VLRSVQNEERSELTARQENISFGQNTYIVNIFRSQDVISISVPAAVTDTLTGAAQYIDVFRTAMNSDWQVFLTELQQQGLTCKLSPSVK
jgi:hypothetical protein